MSKPTSHFSLTALRKSINEHEHPLFTLTKAEMEAWVSRLEKAREIILASDDCLWPTCVFEWLASLEAEG